LSLLKLILGFELQFPRPHFPENNRRV